MAVLDDEPARRGNVESLGVRPDPTPAVLAGESESPQPQPVPTFTHRVAFFPGRSPTPRWSLRGSGRWLAAALVACPAVLAAAPAEIPQGPWFEDATERSGLAFRHFAGRTGEWYFPEINGSGAALFDFDGDGDLDVYLVQGALIDKDASVEKLEEPRPDVWPPRDRLFRNELVPAGELRFTDVTEASRITATGYGMAVAVADFDNDSFPDLYLANWGPNQMWRNRGDGTFEDATEAWGVFESRWSAAASPIDFDGDGWTDLYVGNYLRFDPSRNRACRRSSGARDYCHPSTYVAESDLLLRNRGGERFEDVSARALPERGAFPTLGTAVADFDGDGLPDLYVAHDEQPNQLWLNRGDGTFRDEALLGGCSVNARGESEASMGVAVGDVGNDGDEDVFLTHLTLQTNTLYLNDGTALFVDATTPSGLGPPSRSSTGFGTVFLDVDNDSRLDLVAVNGAVEVLEELAREGDPLPFHQPDQVFYDVGDGRFVDATERAGAAFERSEIGRGLAMGDIDSDGDSDLVVTNNSGPARLLLNRIGSDAAWIGLRVLLPGLREDAGPRPALGARVTVRAPSCPTVHRTVRTDGSYASAHDPRVLVGLGACAAPAVDVEVRWPGGLREHFAAVPVRGYRDLVRGAGRAGSPDPHRRTETPPRPGAPDEGSP